MASLGSLSVDVTANLANLNRGFDRLDRRLRSFQGTMNRTQGSVSTSTVAIGNAYAMMGQMAVKGIKLVIDAVVKLIKKTIELSVASTKMALQYESSMVILKNVFGSASSVIEGFAQTQARALNISKRSAIEYGNTFGTLLLNIGLAKDETAGFSVELLKAAAIIQSNKPKFNMETVMDKMRSGILGNVQAIDDLGIEVKVGMLKATDAFKKFANGRAWKDIPFQTQQIIRMLGILEQKTNIYGATLAKTTNTALSQFKAIMEDASLALGQALLPLVQMAVPIMIRFAEAVEFAAIKIKQFSEVLFGSNEAIKDSSEKASDGQKKLADGIKKTSDEARKSLAPFDKLNNIQEKMASGGEIGIPTPTAPKDSGLGGIADIGLSKGITEKIERLGKAFKILGRELKILMKLPIIKPIVDLISWLGSKALTVATLFVEGLAFSFMGLNATLKAGGSIFKKAFDALKDIGGIVIFEDIVQSIKDIAGIVIFEDIVKSIEDMVQSIKLKFMILRSKISEIWTSIKDRIKLKIEEITGLPWDTIKQAIQLKFMTIRTKIKQIWTDIKTSISDKIKQISELKWTDVTNAMEKVWTGIKTKAKSIWDGIKQVVKNATRGIIDIVNGMINVINSVKITSPEIRNPFTGDVLVPSRTFGFDISNIDTGFLDNEAPKNKQEAEAPSETHTSSSGVTKGGGGGSFGNSQAIDVTLMIDNDVLAKVQVPAHEKEKQRVGNSLTKGGGGGSF